MGLQPLVDELIDLPDVPLRLNFLVSRQVDQVDLEAIKLIPERGHVHPLGLGADDRAALVVFAEKAVDEGGFAEPAFT